MYACSFLSYFQPTLPVISIESSLTSISMSSFLKPGISAFKRKSFSRSSKSTGGTRVSGNIERALSQYDGNKRSSKSLRNLSKTSSNALQRSSGVAGAMAAGFSLGFFDAGAFFFVTATSVFLVSSPSVGFFFFGIKIHHIRNVVTEIYSLLFQVRVKFWIRFSLNL